MIYGPSGGGKSSFVKAGLIPLLDRARVRPIALEATPSGTEELLLSELRRVVPQLPRECNLPDAVAMLRDDPHIRPREKLLLVFDQFEQWLQGRPIEPSAELVRALRQCDGMRVQALLLVRDDFWMALTRLLRAVEVPLVEGANGAAVELFDGRHTRRAHDARGPASLESRPDAPPARRLGRDSGTARRAALRLQADRNSLARGPQSLGDHRPGPQSRADPRRQPMGHVSRRRRGARTRLPRPACGRTATSARVCRPRRRQRRGNEPHLGALGLSHARRHGGRDVPPPAAGRTDLPLGGRQVRVPLLLRGPASRQPGHRLPSRRPGLASAAARGQVWLSGARPGSPERSIAAVASRSAARTQAGPDPRGLRSPRPAQVSHAVSPGNDPRPMPRPRRTFPDSYPNRDAASLAALRWLRWPLFTRHSLFCCPKPRLCPRLPARSGRTDRRGEPHHPLRSGFVPDPQARSPMT